MPRFFNALTAVLTLLLSLGFVLFLAWFVLRWIGKRSPGQGGGSAIKIIDRAVIGREKSLLLVKVGSKTMLIAVTDGAASLICEFSDTESFESLPPPTADFSQILQKAASLWPKHVQKGDKPDEK